MYVQAGIACAIFLFLGIRTLFFKAIEERLAIIKKVLFYRELIIDRTARLTRWQQVRPFIHRGYCGYARSLILDMIEAYEFLLTHKYEKDKEILISLRRLLIEFPPDYDPPATGGSFLTKHIKPKSA